MDRNCLLSGIIGLISTLLGFLAKILYRDFVYLNGIDDFGFAGFLPSFFYVLGFSQLLLIKPSIHPKTVISFVTFASIGFEIMQYLSSNHIDIPDIVASLIGGITSVIILKMVQKRGGMKK